ncbi:uncharacterized protein LOC113279243 [Papaver somniferum]|uniref:uncharacterized protein LOC113279243 n=1 Tax=Papaver somniferum TaxID=3469 RepID=UPI000E6FD4FC|nr:uncharacterized protein LOC113279243 [Papaver somniferum]
MSAYSSWKGFFIVKLDNLRDKQYIKAGRWEVNDQVLRIRNWIPNFRPENQRTSQAMLYVNFPGLSLEYWDEKTLFKISSVIGTPIKVDESTLKFESGYSAKIIGHLKSECRFKDGNADNKSPKSTPKNFVNEQVPNKPQEIFEPFDILSEGVFEEEVIKELMPDFVDSAKLSQIAEDNSVDKSVVQFVNGTNESISTTKNPVTCWSKIIQKPSPPKDQASTSNNGGSSAPEKVTTQNSATFWAKISQKLSPPKDHVSTSNNEDLPEAPEKGNILVFWNKNLPTPFVVSMSSQMIIVSVGDTLVSGVHAHVGVVQRRILWTEMEAISELNKSWLEIGDFNDIVSLDEKVGGRSPNRRSMLDFSECLDTCELIQASHSGLQFSWLKKVLNDWNWSVFGDVNVKIKEAEKDVQEAMNISDNCPYDVEALKNLVEAEYVYNSREVHLQTLLKQKSRLNWIKDGAANTAFLHANLKVRKTRNLISELEFGDGNVITNQSEIADALVKYYKEKFEFQDVSIEESLIKSIPEVITSEDQQMLEKIPEEEEIKETIFSIHPDSSPGPDGFSGCFYRACWHIIKEDVVQAVQFCWSRKFIPKGLNSNFLVLLPKVEGAKAPNQFRPIGLSNQAAYVKGRCIQEQIILASEMVNEMKKKRRCGNVGLELDISQAYDSVSWKFLFKVLQKFGFSQNWCEWIHVLFKSARIYVMLNDGPKGFFSVGRGLRQGDSLSPILFIIMEEILSRNITKMVNCGQIIPMVTRGGIHPTHLMFADDVFIFMNGGKKFITNILKLLEDYQRSSGQVINKLKSKLFIDGTS